LWGPQVLVVVVLRYSRALWAELTEGLTADSLGRVLIHAVRYFGGSPRRWWFEYPDCWAVREDRETLQWRFVSPLPELARHLSAELGVWMPNSRGLAESALHYLAAERVLRRGRGQWFGDNRALRTFLDATAQRRPHPSRPGRSIAEVFAEERRHLRPLPEGLDVLETQLFGGARHDAGE
jgi:transposase